MKDILLSGIIFFIVICGSISATNDLSVKDKNTHGSKYGFIEKATLVVEPFGGYVEESLYLEYSERNQFTSPLLEIVHRFELPKDAVVNDMWLWMGDSVMQAQMYDTWTARHIYDSIAATRYDPAFFAKTGSQYELRIYPLAAGGRRKVKISFIVPTKWYGNQATAELPLKMLLANNASVKPLDILFRTQKDIWGMPSISESASSTFSYLKDTLNYKYKSLLLQDISGYSSLNLKFNTQFTDGYFVSGYQDKSDSTYFQLGILPKDFFKIQANTKSQDVLVALDFSGSYPKDLFNNLSSYQALIDSSLKPNDNFKLLVSGNEKIIDYTSSYLPATSSNISSAVEQFKQSDQATGINFYHAPSVLFCDGQASTNWNYNGLSSIAHVTVLGNIKSAMNKITQYDVAAAYDHGMEAPLGPDEASAIELRLDSLFANGGRFLTYYDYNREYGERLAKHYIQGIKVKTVNHEALTLYRNPDGNIGLNFPESFTRNASYFFEYTDPDVKVELRDAAGNPAVISKKIGRGLIVVTGIWSLRDDDAMKILLGAPLLGINSSTKPYTLDKLLIRIQEEHATKNFSKVLILSDSDSLITKSSAEIETQDYISGFGNYAPRFLTVNLLDNKLFTPSYVTDNQIDYYGSGYLLEKISEASTGIHLEKHLYDWPYIESVFSPYALPALTNLTINSVVDEGSGKTLELREINKLADSNKPRFFLGKSNAHSNILFNISGRFENTEKDSTGQIQFYVSHDTSTYNIAIRTMLGNEKINDLFNVSPVDTPQVVKLSLLYNVLTDYSALLALEPNDRFHFMKDPFDEGNLNTDVAENKTDKDSSVVSVYPNPFNSMTNFTLHLKSLSKVSASIYNILGQKVIDIVNNEYLSGDKRFTWNGKNSNGITVATGFYIFRISIMNMVSLKEKIYTHKLMYLK